MNVESELIKLENESKALKATFERAATTITLFTNGITHTTTQNQMTVVTSGGTYYQNDPERVIVTFNTNTGANTIAKLEIATDNTDLPVVRRLPYSGGAQWSVCAGTKNTSPWQPTNYTFTVQSLMDGALSAAEATS